ncbi:hypothetical protein cce_0351 [Crocosphaera subtropica ATCC 51142]|uniref:Uncharacterized protein n=1 Tax=Crocosphaera subtropica (strain ATCC 51142 / BH68) TaxID=43989 RepID=B1X161_CROS5|nr:type III-B CRISPR-associated protein Cas10/Cmr2 [Crocosphaera subtropica]ACB49702.1 hypothetical protein cce_0351 [Crocosphaera subtropica ATCC 51142]
MSHLYHPYWQAKIWALLHDPALKPLSDRYGFAREGQWQLLRCMQGCKSPKDNKKVLGDCVLQGNWLNHVGLCDLVASASDRSTIGRLDPQYSAVTYQQQTGLQIRHLLSGEPQNLKVNNNWQENLITKRKKLEAKEAEFLDKISQWEDPKKVFWALWRCYAEVLEKEEALIHLLPAETRLPDGSLWSHVSMTSALAGGLAGYYKQAENYPIKNQKFNDYSRPYLVNFTFSPVQELIKASRKMRDFWAGSWILHYLSAKVSYAIANEYGPDTLLYPCLYQQPLIDNWLLEEYSDFKEWIEPHKPDQLLTAGFPNVIIMILPNNHKSQQDLKDNPIYAATQLAKRTLKEEWKKLGDQSLEFLQDSKQWQNINPNTWDKWLKCQWQTYYTAFPIGDPESDLTCSLRVGKNETEEQKKDAFEAWCHQQNQLTNPKESLFETNEEKFLKAIFKLTDIETEKEPPKTKYSKQPNLNVGSWWAYVFDQLRTSLNAVKNARTWELPTAFTVRSSLSGIGSAVHPIVNEEKPDRISEKEINEFWSEKFGLFDGTEKLNATEIVKRVLHKLLPEILNYEEQEISLYYPDLTAGVAGYLKNALLNNQQSEIDYYKRSCHKIYKEIQPLLDNDNLSQSWGIPWINNNKELKLSNTIHHPRLLNAGWLLEDVEISHDSNIEYREKLEELSTKRTTIQQVINKYYPSNNPTNWYILVAGDGDSMRDWLRGSKLKNYGEYLPDELREKIINDSNDEIPKEYKEPLQNFLEVRKRMGPSTHSALSRALLDFSNQLVPYLTEQRYAGRLIYSGGDDVLAYTNLWEWDNWLWDIRQCFKGQEDPYNEFKNEGDYWQWNKPNKPKNIAQRPLFTMGKCATISFGIVIAHHSIPLAIALESLWEAEEEAKEHYTQKDNKDTYKDAVQVRVLYGNGNTLKSTSKFDIFNQWKQLLKLDLEPSLFEQAATIWEQHPIPDKSAIEPWTKAFCSRRDIGEELQQDYQKILTSFIQGLWITTPQNNLDKEVKNWLKLAAFVKRNRKISLNQE